jgi:hypothetical protein
MRDSQQTGSSASLQLVSLLSAWQLYIQVNFAARQLDSLENCKSTTCQIGAWQLGRSAVSQMSNFEVLQFVTLQLWGQWEWQRHRTMHLLFMWIHKASSKAVSK